MEISESRAAKWLDRVGSGAGLAVLFILSFIATAGHSYIAVLLIGMGYIALWCWLVVCAGGSPKAEASRLMDKVLLVKLDQAPSFFTGFFSWPRWTLAASLAVFNLMAGVAWIAGREGESVDSYTGLPLSSQFGTVELLESAGIDIGRLMLFSVLTFLALCLLLALLRQTLRVETHEGFKRLAIAAAALLFVVGCRDNDFRPFVIGVGAFYASAGLLAITFVRWILHGFTGTATDKSN